MKEMRWSIYATRALYQDEVPNVGKLHIRVPTCTFQLLITAHHSIDVQLTRAVIYFTIWVYDVM